MSTSITEPEMPGTLTVVCAWCEAALGSKPCIASMDGTVSHGMCPRCYANAIGEMLAAEDVKL